MTEHDPTENETQAAALPKPPKPGPKPGIPTPAALGKKPHPPVAKPAGEEHAEPDSPVPAASTQPSRWGRVDAEGVVYVFGPEGEHEVGSWQAGSPEEGLAHFARRFDDLRTEVELLHARVSSGSGDTKQAATSARHLLDSLAEAAVVGDIAALRARIDAVLAHAEVEQQEAKRHREVARAEAIARKEELLTEAERIGADSTQWKADGDRLRAILDEWKTVKGVDRKTDDALWKRFAKARESFNRRRGAHFAELDKQRGSAKQRKAELVEEAEALADSTDWGATAAKFRELMSEWKAAGAAHKNAEDALWKRFRAAQDTFFGARSQAFSERDAEFAENAKHKEELLTEAESIDPQHGLDAAKAALRKLQERWDSIGKVPRDRMRELENRFKAVEERVRSAEQASWRRTDPEAQARAEQFAERVAQFEEQARKARAAGDERRARKAEEQAAQWREWLTTAQNAVADR
ncbi:DUF349 domain-containing protein [Sciscionella sediminilitoris]|uniref:DUF349 domain-containing protein n=1 Tax=Sciscionella sediminilitoris TaxID=1445613 RepID=UPI0009E6AA28|nr:DUF349 domain-containing protein [Sciscionella sp. SE31]